MKGLICLVLIVLIQPATARTFDSLSAQADFFQGIYGNATNTTMITKSSMNTGETRPKAVLKGVYYFGGSDAKRQSLSSNYQNQLCGHGFSRAYSVYTAASSACNGFQYTQIGQATATSNGGAKVAALMQEIYKIIKANGSLGPIYLHCYYGVHASNTISQMVLKQFCGISDETAISNWNKVNLYNSLPEPGPTNEKNKIRAFTPDPSLTITPEEQAIVCY